MCQIMFWEEIRISSCIFNCWQPTASTAHDLQDHEGPFTFKRFGTNSKDGGSLMFAAE